MSNKLITDQPDPTKNESSAIWDLVIKDMKDRNEEGTKKYGTPLQAFNGRNSLVDLYQELLDAVVYTRQKIEEDDELQAHLNELESATDEAIDEANLKIEIMRSALEKISQDATNYDVAADYADRALSRINRMEECPACNINYRNCRC